MQNSILIIGACGQIGSELTYALREKYGNDKVIASDIREGNESLMASGPFELLDATNYEAIENVVMYYEIEEVYLMAAMLSATAEKFPMRAWNLNMNSLFNVLNLAKDKKISKVFWPSSIAVFGPNTQKIRSKTQLWNLVRFMVSANNQENAGANITLKNTVLMCVVFGIPA
jgi:nucleoside-diphosphate-sugar epimerase